MEGCDCVAATGTVQRTAYPMLRRADARWSMVCVTAFRLRMETKALGVIESVNLRYREMTTRMCTYCCWGKA